MRWSLKQSAVQCQHQKRKAVTDCRDEYKHCTMQLVDAAFGNWESTGGQIIKWGGGSPIPT